MNDLPECEVCGCPTYGARLCGTCQAIEERQESELLEWKLEAEASGAMRHARERLIGEALKGLEVL